MKNLIFTAALLLAAIGFGLCVRFCLAESSDLSTNVNGKTCTKPVLYAVFIHEFNLEI